MTAMGLRNGIAIAGLEGAERVSEGFVRGRIVDIRAGRLGFVDDIEQPIESPPLHCDQREQRFASFLFGFRPSEGGHHLTRKFVRAFVVSDNIEVGIHRLTPFVAPIVAEGARRGMD